MTRFIGGETLVWSDLDGTHGPGPVRGAALTPLLAAARGRILIAGPHDPDLVDAALIDAALTDAALTDAALTDAALTDAALTSPAFVDAAPGGDLTLLVRGVPDADTLATRYAGRPGVTVLCGGAEKLAAEAPFDTIVALDGLERLSSVEGAQLSWGEAFAQLVGLLRPGGRLLLGVHNHLGLHRLVALPPAVTDSDWAPVGAHDATRPAGLARVLARLGGAGLAVRAAYAAFPGPVAPGVLLGAALLADEEVTGYLGAVLGRACAPVTGVLTDPARLAAEALRHGAAAELAPAWVLVADREEAPHPAAGVADGRDLHRRPGGPLPDGVVGGDEIRRDPAAGWVRLRGGRAEALPRGRTLQDLLLAACLRRDLPAVRELLGAWQAGAAAGVPADQVVAGDDGGLTRLAPAGEPTAALGAFAATVLRGGFPHPWPAPAGEADLARTLAAMAGIDPEGGTDPGGAAPARADEPVPCVRDLLVERDRLRRRLAEADAKAQWYERMLTARDDALQRALRINALLTGSGKARTGVVLVEGARLARRTVRAVRRRLS